MPANLDPAEFTDHVFERLTPFGLSISTPEPLSIKVLYGENEPVLTLNLKTLYQEYEQSPEKLDTLIQPLMTEVGWTINGTRYTFTDIADNSLPMMRDLLRDPLREDETDGSAENLKGPLLYQDLVKRDEEHVIVQFVLAKNELIRPLFTGDMLRSYPDPTEFTSHAVRNLRNVVLGIGLTLSEYKIEDFDANVWLVGVRGGGHRQFLASFITIPDVMRTLQETVQATDGLVALLPSRDQLLVSNSTDEDSIVELGLLARYLKEQSQDPVSSFVWHFNDGSLTRVQTLDVREQPDE